MGRKRNYDRDRALENAMNLFWKKGFEGTHLQELVDVTGMNRFSLYNEFGGKTGLFEAALRLYLDRANESYMGTLGRTPYCFDNILKRIESLHFDGRYHGCFMVNTLTERDLVPRRAFKLAAEFLNRVEHLYLQNLKAAQNDGEVSGQMSTIDVARVLVNLDLGLAISGILRKPARLAELRNWVNTLKHTY